MNVLASVGRGGELALALVLAIASVAKATDLDHSRVAVTRAAFGRRLRRSSATAFVLAVSAGELLLAVGLAVAGGRVVSAAAVAMTSVFVVVVASTQRRGVACGCFGTLVPGTSPAAEMRRAILLFVMGCVAFVANWDVDERSHGLFGGIASGAVWIVVLVGVSRSTVGDAVGWMRSAFVGGAPTRGEWQRARPWTRFAVLRAVRRDPLVRRMLGHADLGPPAWFRSSVRRRRFATATVTATTVHAAGGTVQVLQRPGAPSNVIGFTSSGILLPDGARDRLISDAESPAVAQSE